MSSSRGLDIEVAPDCGNAPRKAQLREWLISLAAGDIESVCAELADDVVWDTAGSDTLTGIEEVRSRIERLAERKISRLQIRHLLSHGKEIAAEGTTVGDEGDQRFVRLVTYGGHGKNAKISRIVSYHA